MPQFRAVIQRRNARLGKLSATLNVSPVLPARTRIEIPLLAAAIVLGGVVVPPHAGANDASVLLPTEVPSIAGLGRGFVPAALLERPLPPAQPATAAAGRVLERLQRVEARLTRTRYQHRTVVNEHRGLYLWDCSGMADWVLARTARRAHGRLRSERPVARTFFQVIDRAPTEGQRSGWQRVAHIEDARPGDLFAWLRPPDWPRRNTGHVGFVLSVPRPAPDIPGAYLVRIADATSVPHELDSRSYPGDGGYGTGTILFTTDGAGVVTGYGWHGSMSQRVVLTRTVFGRVSR